MIEVALGALGLDRGGTLLLDRALRRAGLGERLRVTGSDPALAIHLDAWARARGHRVEGHGPEGSVVVKGTDASRWTGAEQAGAPGPDGLIDHPPPTWGLAARGAYVEAGSPAFSFPLSERDLVWTDDAGKLYAQAAAAQWDPETALDWSTPIGHPEEVEDAIVTIFTYLVENETAALLVPARFLAQIHPHFREILQVLAVQVADEARHIEVFVRRAKLRRPHLGLSTSGGQSSLKTLLDEPDFALASFLLSVMGEGTFLELLRFLAVHAPDPLTADVARLAAQDEARHVAFGLAHLERHAQRDPTLRARLMSAVHRRHSALQHTAGLNEEVFDALVLLAAGSWELQRLAHGWDQVQALLERMDRTRRARLERLGFSPEEAAALSALHTRNFM